jgi:hypothetical protein
VTDGVDTGLESRYKRHMDIAMPTTAPAKLHPFERAGLGKAPFRYIGSYESKYQACPGAPIQPGSSCDYCGTGIMIVCRIKAADGKVFKVGSDCVGRVSQEAAGTDAERAARELWDRVKADQRKRDRAARAKRTAAKVADVQALLADDDNRQLFASLPHPNAAMAAGGHTLLSWAEWMLERAGAAGKCRVAKALTEALTAATTITVETPPA